MLIKPSTAPVVSASMPSQSPLGHKETRDGFVLPGVRDLVRSGGTQVPVSITVEIQGTGASNSTSDNAEDTSSQRDDKQDL